MQKTAAGDAISRRESAENRSTASYMIGDRWRDVACARAAGCRAIFIDRGYHEPLRETPDAIAHEFGEAVALIVGSVQ